MSAVTTLSQSSKFRTLFAGLRLIFPVLKEKGEYVTDITEKLTLQLNDDVGRRLQSYGIKVLPAGMMDTCARGVLVYNVSRHAQGVRWFRIADRWYTVKGRFGAETTTYDASGEVRNAPYEHITTEAIERVLPRFLGEFRQQRPPYDGPRLRSGSDPPPPVVPVLRPVVCHAVTLVHLDLPDFTLDVHCGAGIFVRTLVHDLGKALNSGAHVTWMERRQQGPFTLEHALPSYRWSWDEVHACSEALRDLWFPYMKAVSTAMWEKRHLYEGRAKYQ